MKGTRHLFFLGIGLWLSCAAGSALALPPFARYGPACQWIRLVGEIERPENLPQEETVLLTVTYRLSRQKNPRTLITNRPLASDRFRYVLSGFDEKIDGTIFLEPGFWFSRRIEFQYYAVTPDRKWKSEWRRSFYRPVRVQEGGDSRCRTEIALHTLALEAQ